MDTRVLTRPDEDPQLPPGIYWARIDGVTDALVLHGSNDLSALPCPAEQTTLAEASEDDLGPAGLTWLEHWWPQGQYVPSPSFSLKDLAVARSTGRDATIMKRRLDRTVWTYYVRTDGKHQWVSESDLEPVPDLVGEADWISSEPSSASSFSAMLTRAKLNRGVTDALFSYGVSKTNILPYQFKPVLKYLDSATERMLIADEVGLGKTIEAGLLWTEMAARGQADRVMVVCPSVLVEKWRAEMQARFGFELQRCTSADLSNIVERLRNGTLPSRFAYVVSLQTFRSFKDLDELDGLNFGLDLCIVDEAHQMRNSITSSHKLGLLLRDVSASMILLSATPLNLGNSDLLSLMQLLMPGEVETVQDLEARLDHHEPLQMLRRSATDPSVTNVQRRLWLGRIASSSMGAALRQRAAFSKLEELLETDNFSTDQVPALREACSQLHGLSAVITRTKKSEVRESTTVRHATNAPVLWTDEERDFYELYYEWLRQVSIQRQLPTGFALQMPLRLAGSCLPEAARSVLRRGLDESDGDDTGIAVKKTSILQQETPPLEVIELARRVGSRDSKFDALIEALNSEEMRGRQALLFTFSRDTLAYLRKRLSPLMRIAELHGGVSVEDRETLMRQFRAGKFDLVIATRVASEGLDFEFCSLVINYDLPWNPMEVEQRIGRIDRIGQSSEKVLILNFSTPETIETRILERLYERLGVFEHSIGELEPILAESFDEIQDIVLDFTLSASEQQAKLNKALAAVEQNQSDSRELDSAASKLQAEEQFGIEAVEKRVARGRYLGQNELATMVADWARIRGGKADINRDAAELRVSLSDEMLHRMVTWRRDNGQTSSEITRVESAARAKRPIVLSLNPETARREGGALLNGHHPLVQMAAKDYEDHHMARFSMLQADATDDCPPGIYLVAFAAAEWRGLRPTSELWTAAINLDTGEQMDDSVGALLFSALAKGSLRSGAKQLHPEADILATAAMETLRQRRHEAETARQKENEALVLEREMRAKQVFKNHKLSVLNRMSQAPSMRNAFQGQLTRGENRFNDQMARISTSRQTSLPLQELAIAQFEVV
ncbi:DEAD/DEAH box helicase [Arthrobacter globiformis]|uniref:DEAD/DEAH box helicase n=1 Tax=Arthrobacter globiformis TaxID=1665 RepID=UPI002793E62E|nr:helicase-related protein [Arthrobacter globiformis]MDQ0617362.1 superfamily II DNA or RNA helicase [Arthrobacter globiformis]